MAGSKKGSSSRHPLSTASDPPRNRRTRSSAQVGTLNTESDLPRNRRTSSTAQARTSKTKRRTGDEATGDSGVERDLNGAATEEDTDGRNVTKDAEGDSRVPAKLRHKPPRAQGIGGRVAKRRRVGPVREQRDDDELAVNPELQQNPSRDNEQRTGSSAAGREGGGDLEGGESGNFRGEAGGGTAKEPGGDAMSQEDSRVDDEAPRSAAEPTGRDGGFSLGCDDSGSRGAGGNSRADGPPQEGDNENDNEGEDARIDADAGPSTTNLQNTAAPIPLEGTSSLRSIVEADPGDKLSTRRARTKQKVTTRRAPARRPAGGMGAASAGTVTTGASESDDRGPSVSEGEPAPGAGLTGGGNGDGSDRAAGRGGEDAPTDAGAVTDAGAGSSRGGHTRKAKEKGTRGRQRAASASQSRSRRTSGGGPEPSEGPGGSGRQKAESTSRSQNRTVSGGSPKPSSGPGAGGSTEEKLIATLQQDLALVEVLRREREALLAIRKRLCDEVCILQEEEDHLRDSAGLPPRHKHKPSMPPLPPPTPLPPPLPGQQLVGAPPPLPGEDNDLLHRLLLENIGDTSDDSESMDDEEVAALADAFVGGGGRG
ncbi:unnamed protein product, partial [Discosporangium mesarthrocarpum]